MRGEGVQCVVERWISGVNLQASGASGCPALHSTWHVLKPDILLDMPSWLDIPKVTQAAAIILNTERSKRMSYIRLLKLLYMLERESLQERGTPVLADSVFAMDHGPVLSRTYSLIKGEDPDSGEWSETIRTDGFSVELVGSPGTSEMSRWEISKIHEIVCKFAHLSDWELVKHLHDILPEWQKNTPLPGKSKAIPLADILKEVGRTSEEASEIEAEYRAAANLRRLVASAGE